MCFLALSHAPPALDWKIAINTPVTVTPANKPPNISAPPKNPIIIQKDGELVFNEGCLSVPGFNADVKRAEHVIVEYYDRDSKKQTMECHDFLAVAWQHEMEHLSGHLFIEKLSFLKRKKFEKDWKRELKEKSKKGNR